MARVYIFHILIAFLVFAVTFSHGNATPSTSTCNVKEAFKVSPEDPFYSTKPNVNGAKTFFGGEVLDYSGRVEAVTSPIIDSSTGSRSIIGKLAQMTKEDVGPVLESATKAWGKGQGVWPQMTPEQRIAAIEKVVSSLKERREEIVKTLMWEICKTVDDAQAEFDRTMKFIESVIHTYRNLDTTEGDWQSTGGILAKIRRVAIGIVLCLGPFNYPFNETYATLIPALLMGNILIMKIPTTGGLAHILTMEAFAQHLPPGTINFLTGSGRELLGPVMQTGVVDVLAFIGGSQAADKVIAAHPAPHRLKVFLQLEGKNLGIVLPDADLSTAAEQIVLGATSYNGQRCTAIKLVMVHSSITQDFLDKFVPKIEALGYGLPWSPGVAITPLPETKKVAYLTGLVEDAVSKGATLLNECTAFGSGLLRPVLVYGVKPTMRLWHEEQFGPVIPIAVYNDTEEIAQLLRDTSFGQQASIFTRETSPEAVHLVNILSLSVGRININTQCGRSPDVLPFSGRRSSAMGTMSVSEALRTFSVEIVLAGKETTSNHQIMHGLAQQSSVLAPMRGQPGYMAEDEGRVEL